jgi:hypothetical protein
MLLSTVLNLIFIPVLYVILSTVLKRKVANIGAGPEAEAAH